MSQHEERPPFHLSPTLTPTRTHPQPLDAAFFPPPARRYLATQRRGDVGPTVANPQAEATGRGATGSNEGSSQSDGR